MFPPESRIARLTEYARAHPRAYRARVAALGVLGYAYVLAVLLVTAAGIVWVAWLTLRHIGAVAAARVALPLGFLAWIIVRALWVRFEPPQGIELRRGDAPALFAAIDEVRRAMRAPRVHTVLLTDEFNAGVAQHPRLGVFGWYRVYLTVGLPMLGSMPLDEYRAVLAHEFGHVSRAHGRFGAWVGRVRATWHALVNEMERRNHWGRFIFLRFFRWYSPYFDAYTSVLVRANEFEADRMAADVSAASPASLCRGEVAAAFLDRVFWPAVWAGARTSDAPPTDVHDRLLDEVRTAASHPQAAPWLAEALARPTDAEATHPALRDRLAALGAAPVEPLPPVGTSAAEALLGAALPSLAEGISRRWAAAVGPAWRDQHDQLAQMERRLAELEGRAAAGELDDGEASERILLTVDLHGDTAAVPLMRAFLDTGRRDAAVDFLMGRALAEADDLAALPHLERAMAEHRDYVPPACSAAAGLLERTGRATEAAAFRARIDAHWHLLAQANEERAPTALRRSDTLLPHGLDDAALAPVRALLAGTGVRRAFLVRKQVRLLPEEPHFVLGLEPGGGLFRYQPADAEQRLMNDVAARVTLPGTSTIFVMAGALGRVAKRVRAVPGAEVFSAGGPSDPRVASRHSKPVQPASAAPPAN